MENLIKKLSFICILLLLLLPACTKTPESDLIGEWKGVDNKGKIASIVLEKNKQAKFIKESLVLDGTWSANTTKNKKFIELDLIVMQSTKTVTMPAIIRFLTKNKIQLKVTNDMVSRPEDFSTTEDKNQIVLERQ